ncbi:MAG TPA: hypothetical protein VGO93_04670 [Candidatus Xenobia bacterium]|jgi:hypothetical protein
MLQNILEGLRLGVGIGVLAILLAVVPRAWAGVKRVPRPQPQPHTHD